MTDVSFGRIFFSCDFVRSSKAWPECYIPDSLKPSFLLSRALHFLHFSVCAVFRDVLCLPFGVEGGEKGGERGLGGGGGGA